MCGGLIIVQYKMSIGKSRQAALGAVMVAGLLATATAGQGTALASGRGGHDGHVDAHGGARDVQDADPQPIHLQVVSTNDVHGHLNPGTLTIGGKKVPVGGAAILSGYVKRAKATNPDGTLLLDAGDLVGASPIESQAFGDSPTITVSNLIGYDDVAFGNHEFDAGTGRLAQQVAASTHPYWSANVIDNATGKPYLHPAPYEILTRKGVSVGVINLTTESTPTIVKPSGIVGLTFASTVQTTKDAVAQLHARGVKNIVVVSHLGTDTCLAGCNGDALPTSPTDIAQNEAAKLARALDPGSVDLIVAGHTHQGVNTLINGIRVVEAYSYGTAYADVDLQVDPTSGAFITSTAQIVTTYNYLNSDGTPAVSGTPVVTDTAVQTIVDQANAGVASIKNEVIGHSVTDLTQAQIPSAAPGGESNLGDVIADAMRQRTSQLEGRAVDVAFTNAGGIRADIPAGNVTRGEVIQAFPFGDTLAAVTLTGAQVKQVLEQGASGKHGMVQISGLRFTYDPTQPVGSRVTSVTLASTGRPLDPGASYRVVTNDYMFGGGDEYTSFKQGTNPVDYSAELLSDALVAYLKARSPLTQGIEGRITTGSPAGSGGAATPELGSGELLATGLVPLGLALLLRRRRARRATSRVDGVEA